jgi:hypothetical protein
MMFFGLLSLIANCKNTQNALAVYGHDVWDSSDHPTGFIFAKIFLGFVWIYIFPLVIYLALAASASILLIVNRLASNETIEIRPFEPDGCGGYRPLGQAMLAVTYLNVPFALVLAGDIFAHRNFYVTIILAVALLLGILAFEVFAPFLRLNALLSTAKSARLRELSSALTENECAIKKGDPGKSATSALLAILANAEIYKQTQKMRTWPYMPIDRLKWLTSLVPLALGFARRLISP